MFGGFLMATALHLFCALLTSNSIPGQPGHVKYPIKRSADLGKDFPQVGANFTEEGVRRPSPAPKHAIIRPDRMGPGGRVLTYLWYRPGTPPRTIQNPILSEVPLKPLRCCSTLVVCLALACGGANGPSFNVAPETRTAVVGDQLHLTASANVDLNGDLEWEVEEPYGGGLRNSQGETTVYFAPETAGTYHVTLRAVRADGRKLKETFAIQVLPILVVEPASAQVAQGGTLTFAVSVKGLGRNTVKWSVDEPGGGEIDQDGRYLAPARAGTYHVTAVSTLDPQASARATVVVNG
jgi:hypothetical protein